MSKERKTFTLDSEVYDYLQQPGVNASGLVNDLVKRHMNGDGVDGAIREYRIRQLEEEADEYASRAERKRAQAEKLKEIEESEQEERESELQDAIEKLEGVPRDSGNPAVQTQARKLGMEPAELVDKLPDRDADTGGLDSL